MVCALSLPQGHPSPPRVTPRCLAHPPPPPLFTASRALRQSSTTLISSLTSQARWLEWLPPPPPPQVRSSYSVSKCCVKSEVILQQKEEAASEPPTQNVRLAVRIPLYSRTDHEHNPLASRSILVVLSSFPPSFLLIQRCPPSHLVLPMSLVCPCCALKVWCVMRQQDDCWMRGYHGD